MKGRKWIARDEWLRLHNEYLASSGWKSLRQRALVRDGGACQMCGEPAKHVHHLTYKRWRQEQLFDLVSLCVACHEADHEHGRAEESRIVACHRCGKRHDALADTAYVAWWVQSYGKDADGNEPPVIEAGIYCNGGGKCRDLVDSDVGGLRMGNGDVRTAAKLQDVPTSSFVGEWAWFQMARFVRDYHWRQSAFAKMLRVVRELAAVPSPVPGPDECWVHPDIMPVTGDPGDLADAEAEAEVEF